MPDRQQAARGQLRVRRAPDAFVCPGTGAGPQLSGTVTGAGRVTRKGLNLGGTERPARRVTLDIGHTRGRRDGTWAALTPAEARQLAAALITQATVAES